MSEIKYGLIVAARGAFTCSRWISLNLLGSLSTRDFETRTATGSELFSLLTCPHTTTFPFLSIFSPLEMSSLKSGRQYSPNTRNGLFRLPSASQKRACLNSSIELQAAMRHDMICAVYKYRHSFIQTSLLLYVK